MSTPTGEMMATCEHHHSVANCITCLRDKLDRRDARINKALEHLNSAHCLSPTQEALKEIGRARVALTDIPEETEP